jgi:hypothetical protein
VTTGQQQGHEPPMRPSDEASKEQLELLCGSVASQPAEAAPKLCGERDQILKRLEQAHDETPQAIGLSGEGGVIEVLVSPEGGWTMLIAYPKRPTSASRMVVVGLYFDAGAPG